MVRRYLIAFLILLLGIIFVILNNRSNSNKTTQTQQPKGINIDKQNLDITAEFKIITNGATRIFTDLKYHNLNENVYIDSDNPNSVHVKNKNISWSDFFKTLPMSLDKNCLVTGTKQIFCTGNGKYLKFYINGKEDSNALDKTIKNSDKLLVIFE